MRSGKLFLLLVLTKIYCSCNIDQFVRIAAHIFRVSHVNLGSMIKELSDRINTPVHPAFRAMYSHEMSVVSIVKSLDVHICRASRQLWIIMLNQPVIEG